MATAAALAPLTLETPLDLYPGINPFALDLALGRSSASRFLSPLDLKRLRSRQRRDAHEVAEDLIATNAAWGNDVSSLVQKWRRGKAISLIAGQQVGFGGGPLYTLVKLASLLRLREDLAKRGLQAVVFFWLATEDHDLAEVSSLTVSARDGYRQIHADGGRTNQKIVGPLPIPESLRRQMLDYLQSPEPFWLASGLSFGDSFARLLVSVLGSGSIVMVDSLLPSLRRSGQELFHQLLENHAEVQSLIAMRSREIEAAGYQPQVTPAADGEYSLLYRIRDGEREPIRGAEAIEVVAAKPESISTAALARPLLQDLVLEPNVFVGGPAEVAYYAQITALHQRLGIEPPQVAVRGHVLVAPMKILRTVERYQLAPEEIFLGVDDLIARHESDAITRLNRVLSEAGTAMEEQLERIRSFVAGYDPTMVRASDHSLRKMRHQLRRLGERGRRAIARRDTERHRAISRLSETLMPGGKPQDRVVGWIGYWLQYGKHLLDRLVSEAEPGTDRLKIAGL